MVSSFLKIITTFEFCTFDLIHFEWLYHFKKNVIDSIDCNLKTMLETQESKDRCSKFSVTFIKHLLFGLEIGQWFSLFHLLSFLSVLFVNNNAKFSNVTQSQVK